MDELTGKIIGAGMRVHSVLGNGFQEVVYQRAMGVEFRTSGVSYEREKEMTIYYLGEEVGKRRVDFYVEGRVMVELKAVNGLDDSHLAQGRNYLEAYGVRIGLLINFGRTSLEFRRLYNNRRDACIKNPMNLLNL